MELYLHSSSHIVMVWSLIKYKDKFTLTLLYIYRFIKNIFMVCVMSSLKTNNTQTYTYKYKLQTIYLFNNARSSSVYTELEGM